MPPCSALAIPATSLPPLSIISPRSSCQTNSFMSAGPVPQGPLGSAQWPGKCSGWLGGGGWGGPDQMLHTLNLTLVCHTPLFSPIFSSSKKEQSVHWRPRPPMPFVGLGHTPGPGCCMHSRPVLCPPSPCLRFTGPGLLLSREATHVIKNNCYAK